MCAPSNGDIFFDLFDLYPYRVNLSEQALIKGLVLRAGRIDLPIDHFDLFGLKEPFCNLTGREYRQRDFVTPFLYRFVRHPIQTGVLLGIW